MPGEKIKGLMPRSEYPRHLEQLAEDCAFCQGPEENLDIQEFNHWTWKFSAFPHWNYHTLLTLKRHVETFSELSPAELIDLQIATKKVEAKYREVGIVSDTSKYGNQLVTHWITRSPIEEGQKKSSRSFPFEFSSPL